MEAPTPEFSFNVDEGTYTVLIGQVRERVTKSCTPATADVPPVLPQGEEEEKPKEWFYIDLLTGNSSLRLFIRMDNLYLVGFRTTAGVWWEFNNKKKDHHIPGANVKWLGFGGSYRDLVGDQTLDTIPVGRHQMRFAVCELAKYKTTTENISEEEGEEEYGEPRKMLASVVIMLCEGLRFLTVSGTVNEEFEKEQEQARITPQEATDALYWGKISKAVLTNDFSHVKEETKIENRAGAKKIVALIKYQKIKNEDGL